MSLLLYNIIFLGLTFLKINSKVPATILRMLHASFSRIYIFSLPPEKSNFADEI
jgi:hypothetical protein